MTLIELGYADAEPQTPPSPIDRRSARRLLAALVAVLCLATLTASIRPQQQRALVHLWSVPDVQEGKFTVTGDTVVVVSGAGDRTLTGYALTDGTKLWSRESPEEIPIFFADGDSRILLLPTGLRSAPTAGEEVYFFTETTALDVATGAELRR